MTRTKINLRETFSRQQKLIALSKSNRVCAHCGKPLDLYNMTVDHCIPLSKGGLNSDTNLVALCEDCNQDKSNSVYKPSDYYKYIVPYQLTNLERAFQKYIDSNSWFDIQTFFPMDRYLIPNYLTLMRYCDSYEPKALHRFFNENRSKAMKMGHYYFDRARFRHFDEIVDFIEKQNADFFDSSVNLESIEDHIEFYLKNGAIFTLRGNEGKEIIGIFIFSLECLWIHGEVTFGIKVHNITTLSQKKLAWMYTYIEDIIVKGIMKENNMSHLIIVNENDLEIPYYFFGAFGITGNINQENHRIYYRCLTLDRKGRLIEGQIKLEGGKYTIPEQVKAGTIYYNKFFEISSVTDEKIQESIDDHIQLLEEVEDREDRPTLYGLGILMKKVVKEN